VCAFVACPNLTSFLGAATAAQNNENNQVFGSDDDLILLHAKVLLHRSLFVSLRHPET
jgi:hypothetical protein